MANELQVAMIMQGAEVWNKWREANRIGVPDFSGAKLSTLNLQNTNLFMAYLEDADLSYTDLSCTDLRKAVLRGADLSGATLRKAILKEADLHGANLRMANLVDIDLNSANLNFAILSEVNLQGATLYGANLSGAQLDKTNLRFARLRAADLSKANLSRSSLAWADLSDANVNDLDLTNAECGYTAFGNLDLRHVNGLETIEHRSPSTIGINTFFRSQGKIPEAFLRGAGVPDTFITFMHSLTTSAFDFYSCFISYSSKDESLVYRLYTDLQSKGVRCWYAPEDMKTGDRLRQTIFDQIRLHEKLLVILSEHENVK